MSTLDWLHVGAKVAETVTDPRHPSVAATTVTKIGKRDVVLANGGRFNVNTLRRSDGGTPWGWTVHLMPIDDPEVRKVRQIIRKRNARSQVRLACDNLDKAVREDADRSTVQAAFDDVEKHVSILLEVL